MRTFKREHCSPSNTRKSGYLKCLKNEVFDPLGRVQSRQPLNVGNPYAPHVDKITHSNEFKTDPAAAWLVTQYAPSLEAPRLFPERACVTAGLDPATAPGFSLNDWYFPELETHEYG